MNAVEPAPDPPAPDPWPARIKDRWFLSVLFVSTLGIALLFSPFLYVLLTAAVVVVVAWPLFDRVLVACKGRRVAAAALTVLLLAVLVGGPLGLVLYLFVAQAVSVAAAGAEYLQSPEFSDQLAYLSQTTAWMPDWLARWLPRDFDLASTVAKPLQERAMWAVGAIGSALPSVVGTTVNLGVDIGIFLLAVGTLFVEGPRVLRAMANLSPLDDAYDVRLYTTFTTFAKSVVVGTVATAMVQGAVAGVGYAIAGVDRLVFFTILTACFSVVPVVGTALVWVPLAVVTGMQEGLGWGLFLVGWGIGVAQLDNIVRPLFLGGKTSVHPLLIFLGVFGGMAWMGVPGLLVGPMIVVLFLALYTIYVEDYLGLPAPTAPKPGEEQHESLVRRAMTRVGLRKRRGPPEPPPSGGEGVPLGPEASPA